MERSRPTQVAVLTPPGRGAVATIAIEGPRAAELVAQYLHTRRPDAWARAEPGQIVVARWLADDGEEIVACRHSAERVELHCHGGRAAVERIVGELVARGAMLLDWREWVRQHHPDPIAVEALEALAKAPTRRTAAILLDQFHGSLRTAFDRIEMSIHAGDVSGALCEVDLLLSAASIGRHLIDPWLVVIAGAPNVGKSSLLNSIGGYERAIVCDTPGTTRDVLTVTTALDGWPVEFADTAGLREPEGAIEAAGVELAHQRMQSADLVVLVFDGSCPWSAADTQLAAQWQNTMYVHNKLDLGIVDQAMRPQGFFVSALSGEGIDRLLAAIVERLVLLPPLPGAAVPFSDNQIAALTAARAALTKTSFMEAADALQNVMPRTMTAGARWPPEDDRSSR